MRPHVAMTSVFSSGPLKQTMINSILRSLEQVCGLPAALCLPDYFLYIIITVEMDKAPTELHYRGDDQGTLGIVADG